MVAKKVKKISKQAKKMSKILENVLCIKNGLYTVGLSKDEIYVLLTEHKLIIEDTEDSCRIE